MTAPFGPAQSITMLLGQTTRMQSLDGHLTVTVNEQQFELPALSTAQQRTVVVPIGKEEPAGGLQLTETSWQLSDALNPGYSTLIGVQFGVITTMFVGQVMLGGISSMRTLTLKQHALLVLFASRQQTKVVPDGNILPEGGLQTAETAGSQVFVTPTL